MIAVGRATDEQASTAISAAKLAFVVVLAWLARRAFHDETAYLPNLDDIDAAIHEAGHIVFMPFCRDDHSRRIALSGRLSAFLLHFLRGQATRPVLGRGVRVVERAQPAQRR